MTKKRKALLLAASIVLILLPLEAVAQDYSRWSCGDLWYERNSIYANKGYCFKSNRARRVFGPNCFPPYGRLAPHEERRVAEIKRWERRFGCR